MAVLIFADAPDPGNAERIRLLRTAFQALGATVTALPPVMPMRSFMFVGPLVSAGTTAHMKQFRSAIADHRLVVLVMAEARGADFGGPVLDQVASWCEAAGKPLLLVTGQLNVTVAALSNSGVAAGYAVHHSADADVIAAYWKTTWAQDTPVVEPVAGAAD